MSSYKASSYKASISQEQARILISHAEHPASGSADYGDYIVLI